MLGEVLVRHSTRVRPGDLVTIVSDPSAMPAVEAVFAAALRAGGHPSFHPRCETLHELLLRHGSDVQIRHASPFEAHRLSTCDVLIVLQHPQNTKYLAGIDAKKTAMFQAARRGFLTTSLQRKAAGQMRYVLAEVPSDAAAQDAEMSLTQYADWVYRAGFLHHPDPLAAWSAQRERQERVCEYLRGKHELRFQVPADSSALRSGDREGTDLTVDVSGRTWINAAGEENFPDGEVYSGPRGVEGVLNLTNPAVYRGVEVEGVRLKFRDGRVVEASARRNEDFLIRMLDQDEGARTAGEIAIGTNDEITQFTRNTFFDEKIGGTFHIALGAGYPETGNCNESGLHWDMVCDLRPGVTSPGSKGGTIHADGELFHSNGQFSLPGLWER